MILEEEELALKILFLQQLVLLKQLKSSSGNERKI
jgi:hypothetical protein